MGIGWEANRRGRKPDKKYCLNQGPEFMLHRLTKQGDNRSTHKPFTGCTLPNPCIFSTFALSSVKTQPMRIDIISAVPELLESPLNYSIVKRARDKGLVEVYVHNLREYSTSKTRRVDDYAFGFSAGMVMQIEPIDRIITLLRSERTYDEVIYTSPDGEKFDQKMANRMSMSQNLIILCGHYKGIDHRIREHLITREISIGDFVLTGGEIPAALMTDAIVRLIPGAIGDEQSALSDSFQDNLLAPPVYTRPADYKGWKVPDILLSGHQARVDEWNHQQSLERTKRLRPDLLE